MATIELPPGTGTSLTLEQGQTLTIIDPQSKQVSDLLALDAQDTREVIFSGRTLNYASRLCLTIDDQLYSNRSNVMLRTAADTCGCLLIPYSKDTFRIIYGEKDPHHGCFGILAMGPKPYGIEEDSIPIAFTCFMNVVLDGTTETFTVEPPTSRAGDHINFVAEIDWSFQSLLARRRNLMEGVSSLFRIKSMGRGRKPRWSTESS